MNTALRLVLAVLMVLAIANVWAQELTPDQKKIADLETQNKALEAEKRGLAAQLTASQRPQVSPEEQLKKAQASYAALFKQLKDRVQPGCKLAGGKLSIALTATGAVAGLTCALQ